MTRRVGVLIVFAVALAAGLGHARAARAAAPPNLVIEVVGAGKVTGTGIGCGLGALSCYATYSAASVTLTEAPLKGWTFAGWTNCPTATATTCAATPGANVIVTAEFTPPSGTVQANSFGVAVATPAADGDVQGGPAADPIDCPGASECSITELRGSTITVFETPGAGFFFGGWGGSCSGTSVACATYLNADKTASATFYSQTATNQLTVSITGSGTVTGGGINCGPGATCDAQEPPNANVTLTARASDGYGFAGWGGDVCSGTQPTCTVQMDAARGVSADFEALVPVSLTVGGSGSVSGGGLTCGPGPQTCSGQAVPGSTLTFTASPTVAGGTVIWSGCSSTAGAVCSVNVTTAALSVTATFSGGTAPPTSTYSLTLSVQGDGTVVSISGNAAVHCTAAGGSGCIVSVPANSSVTLSAVPATGSPGDFHGWTAACLGFNTTACTLTMNGPKSVGATFQGGNTTYLLSAQVSGGGTIAGAGLSCTSLGGASCQAPQAAGASVTLTATPTAGASFTGWGGACSGTSSTCQVSMATAKSVTATFGGSGGGTTTALEISVTGAGSVSATAGVCSSTGKAKACTQQYARGQTVTLRAKAAAGSVFRGWSGACNGTKATCDVTMASTLAVGATFGQLALASAAKPKVVKRTVRFTYVAHEAGTVTMTTKGPGTVRARTAKIKAGRRTMTIAVPKAGRYIFTLTLSAKTGKHAIRWRVTVK